MAAAGDSRNVKRDAEPRLTNAAAPSGSPAARQAERSAVTNLTARVSRGSPSTMMMQYQDMGSAGGAGER